MNEKELALYEKIKMCCMLKEQYDKIPEKENKFSYEDTDRFSCIDEKMARQIYIAYLYVVIEGIEQSGIQIKKQDEFNRLKETKYTINGKRVCLKEILKDYRNKTFHNQKRTYYNHNKLYNLDLVCCDLEIDKMIEILKYNIKHNIMIEIQSNINILNSEFMKKGYVTYLKNILNRLKRGNKNE